MLFFSNLSFKHNRLPGWVAACALGVLGGAAAARAQAPAGRSGTLPVDTLTTRLHRLPEARVRAVRPSRFTVGTSRWVIDSLALSEYRGGTVADALAARTPAYLKNYGPGQLASISLRGTAARHTAVLWNGFHIALPTLGETDFNLLPLNGLRDVVVQPGPAAALYGNGAIGGTVLLDTGADFRAGSTWQATAQQDAGLSAWGVRGTSATARVAGRRVAVRAAASYRQAANDYPYLSRTFAGLVRQHAQNAALRHQWSLRQDLTWRLGASGELTAGAWLTDADRQIQPAEGAANDHARERDQSRRLLLGYRRVLASGGQWAVRGAWFDDVLNYASDQVAQSNSDVKTTQAQAEYTRPLGRRGTLRLGAEAQHFAALADGYQGRIAENRGAAFALLRFDPRPTLHLSTNLRQALLPVGLAPLTPTLGAEWTVFERLAGEPTDSLARRPPRAHALVAKANAARTYRAPTLNERYWQPGGNPALRPESGAGAEAGLRYQRPLGAASTATAEATAYAQTVNEWVQWLPDAHGIYSPRNLRQVLSRGLEATLGLRRAAGRYAAQGRLSYALTQTQKTQGAPDDPDPTGRQLAYVPLHQLTLALDQTLGPWQLGTTLGRTGLVYTDNSGLGYLPAYWPLAATAGYTWRGRGPLALTALLQGTNLLGMSYYSYAGRPSLPRAVQASLRVAWR